MKRFLTILLFVVMTVFLTACGSSDSVYVGTWNATQYETQGVTLTAERLGDSQLVFADNGDLKADFLGTEATGEWKETETGVKIISDIELDCQSDGKTLTLDYSGVKITFEKAAAGENQETEQGSAEQNGEQSETDKTEE